MVSSFLVTPEFLTSWPVGAVLLIVTIVLFSINWQPDYGPTVQSMHLARGLALLLLFLWSFQKFVPAG